MVKMALRWCYGMLRKRSGGVEKALRSRFPYHCRNFLTRVLVWTKTLVRNYDPSRTLKDPYECSKKRWGCPRCYKECSRLCTIFSPQRRRKRRNDPVRPVWGRLKGQYMHGWMTCDWRPEQRYWQNRETTDIIIRLVRSVGRAPARQTGGRRFKSRSSILVCHLWTLSLVNPDPGVLGCMFSYKHSQCSHRGGSIIVPKYWHQISIYVFVYQSFQFHL